MIINADGTLEQRSIERVRSDDPAFEESAIPARSGVLSWVSRRASG